MQDVKVVITVTRSDGTEQVFKGEALDFNIECTREMAPMYVLGEAGPQPFVRGKTNMSFSCNGIIYSTKIADVQAIVEEVHYHRFDLEE